jgi:hypothetical protein
MLSVFIDDGLTLDGTVPGLPGISPDLHFVYRIARSRAVAKYLRDQAAAERAKREDDEVEAAIRFLLPQIVSWDAADASGAPVPFDEAGLRRLCTDSYRHMTALINHVQGFASSKVPDPNG